MIIRRIQIEGGFLDSLDLELHPGLNVLIGPRGAGKTSVIELLRFCLGVPGFTNESDRAAREHALSVLGDGRVTITLDVDGQNVIVTRSAEEERARRSPPLTFDSPTILSQKEIELIGRDLAGRLRLIDSFRSGVTDLEHRGNTVRAAIASLSVEMKGLTAEIEGVESQLEELGGTPEALSAAVQQEADARQVLGAAQAEQERLDELGHSIAGGGVEITVIERTEETISAWRERLSAAIAMRPRLEDWPSDPEPAPFSDARAAVENAHRLVTEATEMLASAKTTLESLKTATTTRRIAEQDEARQLRRSLDQIQEGAGALSRRVSDLQEKLGQRQALEALLTSKRLQLTEVQRRRHAALDELDSVRDQRYEERRRIVDDLNNKLRPNIEVTLIRDGMQTAYAGAIASALRGSGVHYTQLSPILAARMSPRELAEAIESGDGAKVAELGEIALDRAQRAVVFMRQQGVEEILSAPLDDSVTISLLDGQELKATDDLSTGQRCTAILPILLSRENRVLVIDQPEDHLDNAFIVSAVIDAVLRIGAKAQLIFSTHNANIPVLGDASRVVLLGSDGVRGFRRVQGGLEDVPVVEAISSVMEGGREAFERRAAFYNERMPVK